MHQQPALFFFPNPCIHHHIITFNQITTCHISKDRHFLCVAAISLFCIHSLTRNKQVFVISNGKDALLEKHTHIERQYKAVLLFYTMVIIS